MNNLEIKAKRYNQRKRRVRAKVVGTETRPRLSVFRSNTHIYAQIIDDIKMVNVNPNQTFTNSYYEDITGATVTLTLTKTCTVLVLATCMGYVKGTGSGEFRYRVSIDGTEDSGNILGNGYESTQRNQVVPYIHMATGIAAGSRIAKLQCVEAVNGVDNYVTYAKLIAIAIAQ